MKSLFFSIIVFIFFMQCESIDNTTPKSLDYTGNWILKFHFLGDALDTPCGYATKNERDLTLNLEKVSNDKNVNERYKVNGQSAVNSYFGDFEITGYDNVRRIGILKVGTFGSTKMAGSQEMMDCEDRFFSMLSQSEEIRIVENNGITQLHIGRFKKDDTPSRDGGTYMIFEKKI